MNRFFSRIKRLSDPTEQAQAHSRVLITVTVLIYFMSMSAATGTTATVAVTIISTIFGYAIVSGLIVWSIHAHPGFSDNRVIFGIMADMVILSSAVYIAAESAAIIYPIYLWIIVGNGMRFGVRYMAIAAINAIVLFTSAASLSPFWSQHPNMIIGMVVGMLLLPTFYASILQKLHTSNAILQKEMEEKAYEATHDALTGLANRSLLREKLEYAIQIAVRNNKTLGVLFIDLDKLKFVNDTMGHAYGDELIKETGNRLRSIFRSSDCVARVGGDEFVVLLTEVSQGTDLIIVGQKALDQLTAPFFVDGRDCTPSASIGAAAFPEHASTPDQLLSNADKAMYASKQQGGARVSMYGDKLKDNAVICTRTRHE